MDAPRYVDSPYLVPFDGSLDLSRCPTEPPRGETKKKANRERLADLVDSLRDRQRQLYADNRYAILMVFQAMDAAGKDGTIRAVTSGINPAGFQVHSFKQPSARELDHDFLWRTAKALPERGRIGVFNRSHYEEALVVRVHPEYLGGQNLPGLDANGEDPGQEFWDARLASMRNFENHLAANGTIILKFFLNVSKHEQRERFLARIDEPESNWKFSAGDVRERGHWEAYMAAYQDALRQTSSPQAPWYAIPADNKPYMRAMVAAILEQRMGQLDLSYPEVSAEDRAEMLRLREDLVAEGPLRSEDRD